MRSRARRLAMPATVLATAALMSGCFGHGDEHRSSTSAAASGTPAAVAPLKVRSGVTRVIGELSPAARKHLAAQAGALVKAYLRAAFLDPPAGGNGAAHAFPGFTPRARALAERDRAVVTGAAYAGADRIDPRAATAYVNVLAPHGHPVGATVRVGLDLAVTRDGRTRPVTVSGRLELTPTGHGWRIFGYDLAQSGAHAGSHG